jgi:hypothetical protein
MDQVLELAIAPQPVLEPPKPRHRQEEPGDQAEE